MLLLSALLLAQLAQPASGVWVLPAGVVDIDAPIVLKPTKQELQIVGNPKGTTLRMSDSFRGRAVFLASAVNHLRFRAFTILGNRQAAISKGLPDWETTFANFTDRNGLLVEFAEDITIEDVQFREIPGFAILASRTQRLRINAVTVTGSGSRNAKGRNNATGGILIEEGSSDFDVSGCTLRNILGNGIWTHSLFTSKRNHDGVIRNNRISYVGRDALQAGHATRLVIEDNTGDHIGYPFDAVDMEAQAIPVVLDTAGDVDHTEYRGNRFEEINGKCVDLDGFHDGAVRGNVCINRGVAEDYPNGHYGIVFNNSNPNMCSERIVVENNTIDGTRYGGIFVIGKLHRIAGNHLRNLNLAGCPEGHARFGCFYKLEEPHLLDSGIYLGSGAERPDPARWNIIENNEISGAGMERQCIAAAPGIADNEIRGNRCSNTQREK